MRRLLVLCAVVIIVAVTIPTYWFLTRPSSSNPCDTGSAGATPLVQPLGTPPLSIWFNNSAKVGSVYWFNFTIRMDLNATIGELTLRVVVSGYWTPFPGASEFLVWNNVPVIVAQANGTSSVWSEGASMPIPSLATVTVVSATHFSQNESLMATVPGSCGTTPTAVGSFGA